MPTSKVKCFNPRPVVGLGESRMQWWSRVAIGRFQSTPSRWTGRIAYGEKPSGPWTGFNPRPVVGLGESWRNDAPAFKLSGFNPRPVVGLGESQIAENAEENSEVSIHAQSLDWANQDVIIPDGAKLMFQSTPSRWTGRIFDASANSLCVTLFQSTPSRWTGRICLSVAGIVIMSCFNPRPVVGLGES